jgi:transcriptional regulator with XRE-family HTH domain
MLLKSNSDSDIADRLRLWRKTVLEMTQEEFAQATGIHLSAIRKYENRHSVPSGESLLSIAKTGIDLHWLLTGDGDMRAPAANSSTTSEATEYSASLLRRMKAIEGVLNGMEDDKRSAILDELFHRASQAKRLDELEGIVGKKGRKQG